MTTQNKINRLAELVGNRAALAGIIGRHPSLIGRYAGYGYLPAQHNGAIKAYVSNNLDERGEEWARLVLGCLEPDTCPCCGRVL